MKIGKILNHIAYFVVRVIYLPAISNKLYNAADTQPDMGHEF